MTTRDALVRESDGKWFRATWITSIKAEIVADDGDFDSVSWLGDAYLSLKGHTYRFVEDGALSNNWRKS